MNTEQTSYRPASTLDDPGRQDIAAGLVAIAREIFGDEARKVISESLSRSCVDLVFGRALSAHASVRPDLSRLDDWLDTRVRESTGAYFTPPELADRMAARAGPSDRSIDLACGTGALLVALSKQQPQSHLTGIEWDPLFAFAAALRLAVEHKGRFQIHWGDGLSAAWIREVDVVMINPPYLGEKGRKDLFDSIRQAHPDLAVHFSARMDLAYLFVHRSLDYLSTGRLVLLSSEYWLTADSAAGLRERLADEAPPEYVERLGAGNFASAPGHHSLIYVGHRGAEVSETLDGSTGETGAFTTTPGTWHPFSTLSRQTYEGRPELRDLARDQQGFVSGLDRTREKRHPFLAHDSPGFVWRHSEVSRVDRDGQGLFRPVIRAADCRANAVFLRPPPESDFVVWLDAPIPDDLEHVIPRQIVDLRASLEQRREAQTGSMPWYRLHWPRARRDQVGPKIVVPRRATENRFCLDLSASHVSSDCTYLVAPEGVADPIVYLVKLMVALNAPESLQYLEAFGKTKGKIVEFYSRPLRELPLPVVRVEDGLELLDDTLRATAVELLDALFGDQVNR